MDGGNPVQPTYAGAASQQWSITDTGGGSFKIADCVTGLVLDSGGQHVAAGRPRSPNNVL